MVYNSIKDHEMSSSKQADLENDLNFPMLTVSTDRIDVKSILKQDCHKEICDLYRFLCVGYVYVGAPELEMIKKRSLALTVDLQIAFTSSQLVSVIFFLFMKCNNGLFQ